MGQGSVRGRSESVLEELSVLLKRLVRRVFPQTLLRGFQSERFLVFQVRADMGDEFGNTR